MLHVSVGRISKTVLSFARCVQLNQVARDVLHFIFRPLFESFPSAAAEFGYCRRSAFTTFVFGYAMQIVNAHKDGISFAVGESNHLLRFAVDGSRDESSELSDTMIAVHYIIAKS